MTGRSKSLAFAPFQVPSFRLQWPADLAASWAFEMETLILGWYVLVETQSVLMLTIFASLQHIGTLVAPMFGVMGDRIGHRNLLCMMRLVYLALSSTLMMLAFTRTIDPIYVLTIAGAMGLVRPSDMGTRAAVVAGSMPPERLTSAMGVQRTTQDSAKIAGALSGAGLAATLGMGPAYTVVAALYAMSAFLTYKADGRDLRRRAASAASVTARASPWRDLKEGLAYVWRTPHLRAIMIVAFVLNMTAFPMMGSLLPYVAKEIYFADQSVLGYMVAGASFGALLGSITMSRFGDGIRPARMMMVFYCVWYAMLLLFAQLQQPSLGIPVLILAGFSQSLSQVPMQAILLRNSEAQYRGRVMGVRMLAIYGNIPGLLLAGPLIGYLGYRMAGTLYCVFGMLFVLAAALWWYAHLWHISAPANSRPVAATMKAEG